MKTLKINLFFCILFLATNTIQAQIRPHSGVHSRVRAKIRAKAKQKAEQERREFVNNKIDEAFDGIDKNMHANLPDSYDFEWSYILQIQTKKEVINIQYFLKPKATYIGFKLHTEKEKQTKKGLMIMDNERNKSIILMDIENNKRLISTKLPTQKREDTKQQKKDYTITKIGTKTILGYTCQGYKIVSKEGEAITYVLENAPVRFNQQYNTKYTKKAKGFNANWLKQFKNGLVMEMDFKSSKKKKYNTKMKCIALKKEKLSINIREYKFFGN